MKAPVLLAIVEHLSDFVANNKPIVGIDCGVTGVEDGVNVFPKQDAVRFGMQPAFAVRHDMSGIERWQYFPLR